MSPLQKQTYSINFSGDLDLKSDPFQVSPNNFLQFNNSVRTVGGQFKKRNGYQNLVSFASPYVTNLATFSGGLIGIGSTLQVYSPDTSSLVSRGAFQPIGLSTIPAIRNSATQTSCDVAIAPNGLACVVCADSQAGVVYQIIDSVTGNVIVPITAISGASVARVFILGSYFTISYYDGAEHLVTQSIPYGSPSTTPTTKQIGSNSKGVYDAFSYGGNLYIAYNVYSGNEIFFGYLTPGSPFTFTSLGNFTPADVPVQISVTVDATDPTYSQLLWVTWSQWHAGTTTGLVTANAYTLAGVQHVTNAALFSNPLYAVMPVVGLTSVAAAGELVAILGLYLGVSNVNSAFAFYQVNSVTCTNAGSVGTDSNLFFGSQVAGKPFINPTNSQVYFLIFYPGTLSLQPTYFLVDWDGNILGKLAYSNGGQPDATVYSSPNQNGNTVQYGYLFVDSIVPLNKANSAVVPPSGYLSQAGANIVTFTFNQSNIAACEIGGSLQISGGFLWMYDGEKPVEQNFQFWPNPLYLVGGTGGSIDPTAGPYWYVATYEWTDAAGNTHRSAPSVPIAITLSGGQSKVTVTIPYLTLTAKIAPNPVRLVVYRYSNVNQVYYQVSSINSTSGPNPLTINSPTNYLATFVDTLSDAEIVGNTILYTTGGVLEDIGAPSSSLMVLFDTRLWLVDAEDPNLLWFSKQVIEATPVEMSDALTYYVSPTTASQTSTGPITSLGAMDDKLIIFKQNAIYYINGTGPDITGNNNQYSQPIFITAAVGCSNQKSIVLTPDGIMFQSGQGIWILRRDLSTEYIGAPVEGYNGYMVTSAVSVPNTTQIRFTLTNGTWLVYDYFFKKWDTFFTNSAPISSAIFNGCDTWLDSGGNLWQENSGSYLDGSTPVNRTLGTPWYNLAGLQGYERAYYFYLLGVYLSPHTLTIQIYFDYSQNVGQTIVVNPNTWNPNGLASGSLEQFRLFFKQQKFQSVRFVITEAFDTTFGGSGGAGFTLSGINLVLGIKKGYKPISAIQSSG